MTSFANNDMQMRLPFCLRGSQPLPENVFGFLDELAMQVELVFSETAGAIIRLEDEVGGLVIVLVHLLGVVFSRVREGFCKAAVAAFVGVMSLL